MCYIFQEKMILALNPLHRILSLDQFFQDLNQGLGIGKNRREGRGLFIAILYYCIILKSNNSTTELTSKQKEKQNKN